MIILTRFDQYQREHPWLALPVAVVRKFSDNRARNYAALIAYYAFVALVPLLLILVTVLGILLRNDTGVRNYVLKSALAHYPVIGPEIQDSITPLAQTGIALVVGLAVMLFGCRRVALAMQEAINSAWEIPVVRRPHGVRAILRGFALLAVIGTGLIATSILSGLVAVLTFAISLLLNIAMFWAGFKLAAAPSLGWRQLLPGALIGAVGWQVLQGVGGYLVTHQLARASTVNGTFAIVLGLVTWLYVEAQFTVWALEASAVLEHRLWPRSLQPPLTAADRQAFELYAEVEKRHES